MLGFYGPHLFMHAAAIISVGALALRDQLKLRTMLFVSIALSAFYNDVKSPPDYQAIMWNAVSFAINVKVVAQIVLDRTAIGMSEEEARLFAAFELLTPGEFRAILKLGIWRTASGLAAITHENRQPNALYYVVSGTIDIDKGGRRFAVEPHTFIGEIAFLQKTPASATVTLAHGARYIEWPIETLRDSLSGRQGLRHALIRLISFDMATKVARA